jgi:Calpain family cysteine protease
MSLSLVAGLGMIISLPYVRSLTWNREAIEDLTGGVTSEIYSSDILDKDEFWTKELLKVGKDFLYGCSTGQHADWLEPDRPITIRKGILEGHAYSIMDAVEHIVDGTSYRLVKVRNPWGNTGWSGPWSDGAAEWTPQWMERLQHKFGDDGVFWMSYDDLLRKYQRLDRTRIFGPDWKITQQWTSLQVPWSADYHQTRFSVNVTKDTPVVIVLSQLDRKYFAGLEGQYDFKLQFRVQRVGEEEDYIVRSNVDYYMTRSVSTDITLEAGSYFVLMKVTAIRMGGPTLDEVVADKAEEKRDKLIQVGLSYDLAHAKGVVLETEKEKEERELHEKTQETEARDNRKKKARERKEKEWKKNKKLRQRERRHEERRQRRAQVKARHSEATLTGYTHDDEGSRYDTNRDAHHYAGTAGDVRSLTGEFIASYERSEGPSPTTETREDAAASSTTTDKIDTPTSDSVTSAEESATPNATAPLVEDHPVTPKVQINGVDAITDVKPLKKRPASLLPDRTRPNTTASHQQTPSPKPDDFPDPPNLDSDSDSDFSWQTDLDFDSDSSERPYAGSDAGRGDRDWDRLDDSSSGPDPWNAVCVVGLRVYSKDPDLSLEVVRPNPYEDAGGKKDVVAGGALDRDDPAKGALAEKWAKTPMRPAFDSE